MKQFTRKVNRDDASSSVFGYQMLEPCKTSMPKTKKATSVSNGVKTQALLSHFVLQCFNILLCLCRSISTRRSHEIHPGL